MNNVYIIQSSEKLDSVSNNNNSNSNSNNNSNSNMNSKNTIES
jgi:hypothetical protein